MVFWGLVLIAVGLGVLLDVDWGRYWAAILIAWGVAFLWSALRSRGKSRWFSPWCCWWGPGYWDRREEEGRGERGAPTGAPSEQ